MSGDCMADPNFDGGDGMKHVIYSCDHGRGCFNYKKGYVCYCKGDYILLDSGNNRIGCNAYKEKPEPEKVKWPDLDGWFQNRVSGHFYTITGISENRQKIRISGEWYNVSMFGANWEQVDPKTLNDNGA